MTVCIIKQTNIFQEAPCLLEHVKCIACLSEAQEKAHRFKIKQIFYHFAEWAVINFIFSVII